jgi:hypothetical protein
LKLSENIQKIDVYASSEKFKENEKNLNEERLRRESKTEIPLSINSRKLNCSPGKGINNVIPA